MDKTNNKLEKTLDERLADVVAQISQLETERDVICAALRKRHAANQADRLQTALKDFVEGI